MLAPNINYNTINFGLEIDANANIVKVLFSNATILGNTPKNLIGKPFEKIFSIKKNIFFVEYLKKIKPQQALYVELDLTSFNKKKYNYIVTIICNNTNAYSLIVDTSNKQKNLLEKSELQLIALQEINALNHQIIQNTQAIILRLNTNCTIASISQGAEKMLGYKANELLNQKWFSKIVNQKIYPQYQQGFEAFLASTKKTRVITAPVICKDGNLKAISWKTSKIFLNNTLIGTVGIGKDITDLTKKVAALEESENNFKNLAQLVQIPLSFISIDGTITFVNDAYTKEYGFTLKEIPDVKTLLSLCYSDSKELKAALDLWKKEVELLKKQKKILHKTAAIKTKLGIKKIVEYSAILNDDYIFYSYFDKTAQIEKENLLIQNQEKFKRIAENLPIAVAGCSTQNFSITFMNNKFVKEFGYEKSKIADYNIWREFIILDNKTKEERDVIMKNIVEDLINNTQSKTKLIERNILCKTGIIKTFEIGLTLDKDTIYAFFYDITEQKIATELLIESEQKFKALAQNMPMAIGSYDENGNTLFVNKHFTEITGYITSDIPRIKNWYKCTQPNLKLRKAYHEHWVQIVAAFREGTLKEPPSIKALCRCKDGNFKYFSFSFSIHKNITYILIIDITETEKAKMELEKSHTELRNFGSYLQNTREEERKNISREIHDELGQQLTGIKMEVSAIFRGINPLYKQHQDAFNKVLEMINYSVKTVRKISAQLRPSILDDLGLAAAIEWHTQEFYKRFGVICIFDNDLNNDKISPTIESNLYRILQESLTNISRHANAKKVIINLRNTPNSITLIISDDGIGFSKNQRTSTLGLLGMKERVIMMNGEFKIQSEKGKGTIIKVTIPLKQIAI